MLEIIAEFEVDVASCFSLELDYSADGTPKTSLIVNTFSETLRMKRDWSEPDPHHYHYPHEASLPLTASQCVKLHVVLDRSVIEVFANGTNVLSSRVYPASLAKGIALVLSCQCGQVRLKSLEVWTLQV